MAIKLLDDNKRFLDFLGVTEFHNAGYYGQFGLSAIGEEWSLDKYDGEGLVYNPLYDNIGSSEHGIKCCKVFHQFAPKRKIIQFDYWGDNFFNIGAPYLTSQHVDSAFCCMGNTNPISNLSEFNDALNDSVDFLSYFAASGNENNNSFNQLIKCDNMFGVGAYSLLYPSNEIVPTSYTSESEYVDFAAPALITIETNGVEEKFPGTSCSTPVLAGMCALVNDFFIDKTGKPLSRDKMYQFIIDHCVDISEKGKDLTTGYGAFILPKPNEIDVEKYRSGSVLDKFKDKDQISSWAIDYVEKAVSLGIMNGTGDNFNPKGNLTREQASIIMVKLYDKLNGGN